VKNRSEPLRDFEGGRDCGSPVEEGFKKTRLFSAFNLASACTQHIPFFSLSQHCFFHVSILRDFSFFSKIVSFFSASSWIASNQPSFLE
jgi:hypothetical protein